MLLVVQKIRRSATLANELDRGDGRFISLIQIIHVNQYLALNLGAEPEFLRSRSPSIVGVAFDASLCNPSCRKGGECNSRLISIS